jgi:hypothetical protein
MWGNSPGNIAKMVGKVLSFFALIYLLFYADIHIA